MTDRVYIQPIGFANSPQSEEGDAIRLAGGMVYAHRFAVILRRDGTLVERHLCTPRTIEEFLTRLPESLASDAVAQWAGLTTAHPPMQLGDRAVPLDQPQIMGILNVTPDSFSDGGQFLDDPDAGRSHAAAMLEAGAAIVDIGGESTRPGAAATWEGDELKRVI
ncbi:MAG: dihydropteroate synthase, partial [Pontixanthobacter sp.]